jgi:antitoxin ParD1/3/4
MRRFVEEKIKTGGYGTISEYVRELIRTDQRLEQTRFESLIAEALRSGEPSEFTRADITEARRVVKDRISKRNRRK